MTPYETMGKLNLFYFQQSISVHFVAIYTMNMIDCWFKILNNNSIIAKNKQ